MTQLAAQPRPSSKPSRPLLRRPTLPAAHGEPAIWVLGASLVLALIMILGIFGLIVAEGSATFWPRPIDKVNLTNGQTFLGVPVKDDPAAGRRLYRVGNRDVGRQPFRWVQTSDIASLEQPKSAVLLERTAWGIWLGEPRGVVIQEEVDLPAAEVRAQVHSTQTQWGPGRVERKVLSEAAGRAKVLQRTIIAEEPQQARELLAQLQPQARARAAQIERLTRVDQGNINHELESLRLRVRRAELDQERAARYHPPVLAWWGVAVLLVAGIGCFVCFLKMGAASQREGDAGELRKTSVRAGIRGVLLAGAVLAFLFAGLENPAARAGISPDRVAAIRLAAQQRSAELQEHYEAIQAQIAAIEQEDARFRALVVDPATGAFAPSRQSQLDDPMRISQVVRIVPANELNFSGRLGVYFSRWWEYLSTEPREANTEGGVWPVIFGTVVLTLLLSIVVVPMGVVAALYLREYARQGLMVSLIRIAVNNLAGVPSIVYGMFGLGFFAYTLGGLIDRGPSRPMQPLAWWWMLAGAGAIVGIALALSTLSRGISDNTTRNRTRFAVGLAWLAAAGLAIWAITSAPYFGGFFREKLPTPTFGTRGILWAALTLALLTLPVVIVATEEAIAAVPRSVREGSYGCGASKWQTVRRIVLPQALPGIMTGGILAMARGAGEVAPLMLVGAVKLAPELPVDGHFPFIHPERSFMHLGFHIYDLGFQSPDSEAARPLVWTTTLLLVTIVLVLNLTAVIARARLRAKAVSSTV